MQFRNFASSYAVKEELYAASRATNRLVKLSGIFSPSASNKADGDSTAVTCLLETRPLSEGVGLKAFGDAELLYDMRDAASDDPVMGVHVAPGVEATTYGSVPESPLGETTDLKRKRLTISKDSECVSLKLFTTVVSSKTEIYGVEWTERPYSPFAEGQ